MRLLGASLFSVLPAVSTSFRHNIRESQTAARKPVIWSLLGQSHCEENISQFKQTLSWKPWGIAIALQPVVDWCLLPPAGCFICKSTEFHLIVNELTSVEAEQGREVGFFGRPACSMVFPAGPQKHHKHLKHHPPSPPPFKGETHMSEHCKPTFQFFL